MINSFWNGKIRSLPIAIGIIMGRFFTKFCDKTATLSAVNLGKCHSSVKIMAPFSYRYPSRIEFGKGVVVSKGVVVTSELNNETKLVLCDNVTIGMNCRIDFTGGVTIRENSHLAHNVVVLTHDHGYDHKAVPLPKGLEIGENVFVGMNSIITHNVSQIGKNVVVGVGSVLTKDVPDNAIVAGAPARIINFRGDI